MPTITRCLLLAAILAVLKPAVIQAAPQNSYPVSAVLCKAIKGDDVTFVSVEADTRNHPACPEGTRDAGLEFSIETVQGATTPEALPAHVQETKGEEQ